MSVDRSSTPDYVVKLHDPRSDSRGTTVVGAAWHQDDDDTIRIKFRSGIAISTENASLTLAPWDANERKPKEQRPPLTVDRRRY